jgi:hypothetical protein
MLNEAETWSLAKSLANHMPFRELVERMQAKEPIEPEPKPKKIASRGSEPKPKAKKPRAAAKTPDTPNARKERADHGKQRDRLQSKQQV